MDGLMAQLPTDRWRVTEAGCSVEEHFKLIQSLTGGSGQFGRVVVRLFQRRHYTISAEIDRQEENPTISYIVPNRLYVTEMRGEGHKLRLPGLSVISSAWTAGIDYIDASDSDYDWKIAGHGTSYNKQLDSWKTRIVLQGSQNAYLNVGKVTLTLLEDA